MFQKPSRITRLITIGLLLLPGTLSLWAQTSTPPAGARRGKSHQQTCDGALDIVPVKSMTFARKRKPAPKSHASANETRQDKR